MDWIEIGPGFWNLRSSLTFVFGMVDIGTHASLIRMNNGRFLLIDTVAFTSKALRELNELTQNGTLIDAVIGTHPFHTMFFPACAQIFPNLRYIGTPRHLKRGGLKWSGNILEELRTWEDQGVFMRVPAGADIVTPAESNHFSCVHVFHAPSRTIHVDDTIMFFDKPGFALRCLGKHQGKMEFWDLDKGLEPNENAPAQFKAFIQSLIDDWDFANIVAAHTGNRIGGAKEQLRQTLAGAEGKFQALAKKHAVKA